MSDLTFGLTMTILGMGVTLLTLLLLGVIIRIMKKIYPYEEEKTEAKK